LGALRLQYLPIGGNSAGLFVIMHQASGNIPDIYLAGITNFNGPRFISVSKFGGCFIFHLQNKSLYSTNVF